MTDIAILDETMRSSSESLPVEPSALLDDLLAVMERLDFLLAQAVAVAREAEPAEEAGDPYRGLHLDPLDVERLLSLRPGRPLFASAETAAWPRPSEALRPGSRLAFLQRTFGLSSFDLDVLALALAPEFDLRYEGLYAYLQDDVTRKRPSVDLALNLLCTDAATKLERRARFAPEAPLVRHGLLTLSASGHHGQASSLGLALKPDDQVTRFLLGMAGLDPQLAGRCTLERPTTALDALFLPADLERGLRRLAQQAGGAGGPVALYLQGEPGLGQRALAGALAREVARPLLALDGARIETDPETRSRLLRRVATAAKLHGAVVFVDGWDRRSAEQKAAEDGQPGEAGILDDMAALQPGAGLIVLAGEQAWPLQSGGWAELVTIPLAMPDTALRRACWQAGLSAAGLSAPDGDLDALADRFRLGADQIEQAVAGARSTARWRSACQADGEPGGEAGPPEPPAVRSAELFAAARARSGHDLAALSRKVAPRQSWRDLVLPADPLAQLKEICNQAKHRPVVHGTWGFGRKLSSGKGLTALFSGPPGTGKTMAAEVIAKELELDLYKIDLAQIVSKYIGETEKNLNRVFSAAERANAILLFDEADAIFGKRSEVKDAHDRYANLEVAYLLQKMEDYEGVSILTSNLRQNLDEAFTRRIGFIVEFPSPEEPSRQRIWQGVWPKETPLAASVDLALFAKQFKLAGGNIRNIAVAAAFLAAEEGRGVRTEHLLSATRREFKKMGRLVDERAFLPFGVTADATAGEGNASGRPAGGDSPPPDPALTDGRAAAGRPTS